MSIFSVFTLLGGLAFFIYGMNQMSHSLEKITGERMESIINHMTQNRFVGLLMGFIVTAIIQSSAASLYSASRKGWLIYRRIVFIAKKTERPTGRVRNIRIQTGRNEIAVY